MNTDLEKRLELLFRSMKSNGTEKLELDFYEVGYLLALVKGDKTIGKTLEECMIAGLNEQ